MKTELEIMQSGSVLAKASKLDSEFQQFLVRELPDGSIEYYHKQNSDWYTIPSEWITQIIWAERAHE